MILICVFEEKYELHRILQNAMRQTIKQEKSNMTFNSQSSRKKATKSIPLLQSLNYPLMGI